jgi:lipopolysaccharide/colanic/teichoic acid biosynthesis glycosyltransferase
VTGLGDPRITRVGRWLRRLKLDELPQLWNVLRGEMAIIGPRPEVPRFVAQYNSVQRAILEATPGLASMAQLVFSGEAQALSHHPDPDTAYVRHIMPRKLAVDLAYERRRTLLSDLGLMVSILLLIVGWNRRAVSTLAIPGWSDPDDRRA